MSAPPITGTARPPLPDGVFIFPNGTKLAIPENISIRSLDTMLNTRSLKKKLGETNTSEFQDHRPSLEWAVSNRHMWLVQLWLENKFYIQPVDKDALDQHRKKVSDGSGGTLESDAEAVEFLDDLLERAALDWKNPGICRLLLANGAKAESKMLLGRLGDGENPEMLPIGKLLLEYGTDIEFQARTEYGVGTALHYATLRPSREGLMLVSLLLDARAFINSRIPETYSTPLHNACSVKSGGGYRNIIKLLLEAGADADAIDIQGKTPLFGLLDLPRDSPGVIPSVLVEIVLYYMKDVNHQTQRGGNSALHYAVFQCLEPNTPAGWNTNIKILNLLINKGAQINCQNKQGTTVLHIAASGDCIDTVRFLVMNGADISIKNNNGNTALEMAKDAEIASYLLNKSG